MTYFDHNATTPLANGLSSFVKPYFEAEFGNPSSSAYQLGRNAREAIDQARVEVSELIDAEPGEIIFTSGGTESIILAILGIAMNLPPGDLILRSAVEHSSVVSAMSFCKKTFNLKESLIPVSKNGQLELDLLDPRARLVSVMFANNETGVIHDIASLRSRIGENVLLHVDAIQGVGKVPFSFKALNIDLCSFSAHKFGGPKGVGVLVVREGIEWQPPFVGGGQELGRRGGTESVPLIAGMGYASKAMRAKLKTSYFAELESLRNYFEYELRKYCPFIEVVGGESLRLPNTSNIIVPSVVGNNLVSYLGDKGICISTGSACKTNSFSPSVVLTAMGYSSMSAVSAIRVSFGEGNNESDVDLLIKEILNYCNENKVKDLIK